jgi:hypothetical protein
MIPGNDLSSIWVSGEVTELYVFSLFTALDSWKGKRMLLALLKNVMMETLSIQAVNLTRSQGI